MHITELILFLPRSVRQPFRIACILGILKEKEGGLEASWK